MGNSSCCESYKESSLRNELMEPQTKLIEMQQIIMKSNNEIFMTTIKKLRAIECMVFILQNKYNQLSLEDTANMIDTIYNEIKNSENSEYIDHSTIRIVLKHMNIDMCDFDIDILPPSYVST